jgi:serine/threonine protein kinase
VGVAVDQDANERTVVERRDPLVGQVFDRRFQIEARIAAGGFGAIYRATHLKSGHKFALKILHANLTSDQRVVARFRREGATLTRLRDPHTIIAYELGEADDGTLYIVMELLHGESLYERYRSTGAMPWPRVLAIARAVCSSLAEAHALGIIHRDLKPTNIHLEQRAGTDDFVKVLDFGIAKILQDSEIDSTELTHAGQMVGTLDYMSPEQMVGGNCTATSDVYTLGIVMYEMIAGKRPFDDANSAAAALAAVLTATPDRLSTLAIIPAAVDHLVMRCLDRQPTGRYQSALELAAALDELVPGTDELSTVAMTTLPGTPAPKLVTPAPRLVTPAPQLVTPAPRLVTPTPRLVTPAPELIGLAAKQGTQAPPVVTPAPPLGGAAPKQITPTRRPTPPVLSVFVTTLPLPVRRDLAPEERSAAPRDTTPDVAARTSAAIEQATPGVDLDSTIIGHQPASRRSAATPAVGTPHVAPRALTPPAGVPHAGAAHAGAAQGRTTNLREAYPMITRPAPSPMRSPFDDRPPSSIRVMPFDAAAARRDVIIRRIIIALAVTIAFLVAILVTRS